MRNALLVVTAVAAEADAVRAGLATPGDGDIDGDGGAVTVAPVGVGPAAAAAGTARLLALAEAGGRPYRAVLSAGIGGGFPGRAPVGSVVLATRSVAADLGAESPDGFLPLDELGFGSTTLPADPALLDALRAALPQAVVGAVLTLGTVTGTAATTATLHARHPDAAAEAMEGYGVAVAAAEAGLPFAELRAISNPIGPRDRSAWRIGDAFAALTAAFAVLGEKLPG
ncbi:futalosine hydrolase [Plantactinospora sp. CA-290183]|uniref:futalosine hydrolase n=1 Tax=Plantactinospora sp. CA-290183 TaxID=3240006 RepID=UPI003D94A9FE